MIAYILNKLNVSNKAIEMTLQEDYPQKFINFMFNTQHFYKKCGDVDRHYYYAQEGLDYLYRNIVHYTQSEDWIGITDYFSNNADFWTMYFTNVSNLKNMFIQRSEIFSYYLNLNGFKLNYLLPPKPKHISKIRIGIIKEHYQTGSETFASLPIFECLDHSCFEVFLYSFKSNNSTIENYCKACSNKFILLPLDIHDQVNILRNSDLDILFFATNITGKLHSFITCLAFHRLARVQVTSICSPVSSGIKTIDYFLSGDLTTPLPKYQEHFSEKLITIEGSGICFQFPDYGSNSTIQTCRKNWSTIKDTVIFISGANYHKIIPEVRYAWAEIISKTDESILILYPFNPINWGGYLFVQEFIDNMKTIFKQYGINEKRLIIEKPLPEITDVRQMLRSADIYLDTFPYTGATSLIDPLTIGLPAVVYEGNSLRSRQGASLFKEIQLADLIVSNEKDYIQLAIDLASNKQKRKYFHDKIKKKMQKNPPFLDSKAYANKITSLFKYLVRQDIR